jgi:invasion protein IalB
MHAFLINSLVAAGLAASASPPLEALQGGALPADATSVQEIYEDWTVSCAQKDGKRLCSLSQQQLDKDSRQRVVALELNTVATDKAEGTLLLPFGLALDQKVTLQLDGAQFGIPLPYRTCLSPGCLVRINLDARGIGDLKKGTALAVKAMSDGGQPVTFTLSLKGFGSAFDRMATLGK